MNQPKDRELKILLSDKNKLLFLRDDARLGVDGNFS
jgi:hypothetical protein